MPQIIITIKTPLLPEACEKLEDELAGLLYNKGMQAVIEDSVTGNSTTTESYGIYIKQLKKPEDIIGVHNALEDIFGE